MAKLIIKDITDADPNSRRIHTNQFVVILWHNTHSKLVDYFEKDGTPNFKTSAQSELFERIKKEGLPFTTVAELAEFTDLKRGLSIPYGKID